MIDVVAVIELEEMGDAVFVELVVEYGDACGDTLVACSGVEANGMSKTDIVKFTTYLTDARFIGEYREARSNIIGDDIMPTSTLLIVAGLAAPQFLVEIEAWAAKSTE